MSWFKTRSNSLFFLMVAVVCLLNVNYAILRSARNALTVADLGGGAGSIPLFELCGTMPGAVLMTFFLTKLLNRFSIYRVFLMTLSFFVGFFLIFSFMIYPNLGLLKEFLEYSTFIPFHQNLAILLPMVLSMLFFVMAELWKISLLTVLFWGLVNHYIPMDRAKKYYAPLMLGGSIGTIVAGPLISICTSDFISNRSWSSSLGLMMGMIALISLLIAWMVQMLWKILAHERAEIQHVEKEESPVSVWDSIKVCMKSSYLLLLAWITVADYIAYALGEVIFLDVLKQKYPDPRQYCDFMGSLSLWNGVLTAISALFITPFLLKKCRWIVASLVTPICLLVTQIAFFFALSHPIISKETDLLILFGTLMFCLVRAAKYTLFDTSKELSFLLLPPLEKMQGKLVIDGMCARIGRGGASFLSLLLIQVCGSVLAIVPVAAPLALLISASCALATSRLGVLVEKRSVSSALK